MTSDVRGATREYVRAELLQDRPDYILTDDTDLLTEHIVDSLGIFMLITFLEERFGITVDADEVLVEHFESVAAISGLVESKLQPASSATGRE